MILAEGIEHLGADVAVRVVEPDGEDDHSRRDGSEEVVHAPPIDADCPRTGSWRRPLRRGVGTSGRRPQRTRRRAIEHERDASQLHIRRKHDFLHLAVRELVLEQKDARRLVCVGVDEAVLIVRRRVNDASADVGFNSRSYRGVSFRLVLKSARR